MACSGKLTMPKLAVIARSTPRDGDGGQGGAEAFGDGAGIVGTGVGQQQEELFSAAAAGEVAGAHGGGEGGADGGEDFVALVVAVQVVDLF